MDVVNSLSQKVFVWGTMFPCVEEGRIYLIEVDWINYFEIDLRTQKEIKVPLPTDSLLPTHIELAYPGCYVGAVYMEGGRS